MSKLISTIKNNSIPYQLDENWTWYKWGDLIESYQQGLIRSNSELNEEVGIDYFKMNFINENGSYTFRNLPKTFATEDEIRKFKINSGDFFINVRNSKELVGKSCVVYGVDRDLLFNHMLIRVKHKDYISGSFINAYLNTPLGKKLLDTCKKGTTTVIALYQKDIYELPIPIPSKGFLKGIDSIYNNINKKIELNNHINAELEQMAKALYDYWFVQFDFPDKEGKPYKSSGGKMVYNEILKREVPEGWEVEKLGLLGTLKNGINYDPKLEGDSLARIINVRNISQSTIFIENSDLDELRLNQTDIDKYLVDDNSIIIARSGTPGATRLIKNFDSNTIYCGFIICLTVSDSKHFNLLYFNLKDFEKNITSQSNGTIMKNVNQQILNDFNIVVPPNNILNNHNSKIDSIFNKILNNLQQNQQLSTLRDWLLPMLMNGQVKVEAASIALFQNDCAISIAAEPQMEYKRKASAQFNQPEWQDQKFSLWLSNQGLAARGAIDTTTLRAIFDAMDDEDK